MLEIIDKNQWPGLSYRGVTLHDPERPVREAEALVDGHGLSGKTLICVFGLGLGYHLRALWSRFPGTTVVAFDPEPELRRAYADFGFGPDQGKTKLIVAPDLDELDRLVTDEVVHGDHPDPGILIHPGYALLFPKETELFGQIVRGARLRRAVIDKTRREKGRDFLANLALNMPSVLTLPDLARLQNRLPALPGLIVGSGPGLEKNARLLKDLRGNALILAASSAWKPLIDLGIHPDVVVVIEADDTSGYLTEGVPGTILALASASHPSHFQAPGFTRAVFHLTSGAAFICGSEDFVPQGGVAGSAAFTIGLLLGLNPLVLLGQDQAYGPAGLHARGTPGEASIDDLAVFEVAGEDGRPVRTHSGLLASIQWYCESARYLKRHSPDKVLINATESGARIPGIPNMKFREVMDRYLKPGPPGPNLVKLLHKPAGSTDWTVAGQILRQTWELLDRVLEMFRYAPDRATEMLEACRSDHPFLREALAELDRDPSPTVARTLLLEVEGRVLDMLRVVDARDGDE